MVFMEGELWLETVYKNWPDGDDMERTMQTLTTRLHHTRQCPQHKSSNQQPPQAQATALAKDTGQPRSDGEMGQPSSNHEEERAPAAAPPGSSLEPTPGLVMPIWEHAFTTSEVAAAFHALPEEDRLAPERLIKRLFSE